MRNHSETRRRKQLKVWRIWGKNYRSEENKSFITFTLKAINIVLSKELKHKIKLLGHWCQGPALLRERLNSDWPIYLSDHNSRSDPSSQAKLPNSIVSTTTQSPPTPTIYGDCWPEPNPSSCINRPSFKLKQE